MQSSTANNELKKLNDNDFASMTRTQLVELIGDAYKYIYAINYKKDKQNTYKFDTLMDNYLNAIEFMKKTWGIGVIDELSQCVDRVQAEVKEKKTNTSPKPKTYPPRFADFSQEDQTKKIDYEKIHAEIKAANRISLKTLGK